MLNKVYTKVILLFGFICTFSVLLYFFTFYFSGENPLMHMSRFDIVIVIICAAFAILYYRNFLNQGKLHYWEALIIGTSVNFIGTFLSSIVIYIFIAFIDPQVMTRHIAYLRNILIKGRQQMDEELGKDVVEKIIKNVISTTPADIALDLFIKKFFVCLVVIGLIGAFLRKP